MPALIATQDALHAVFHPRAVAVISRRLKEVDGNGCFPDLAGLPDQVATAFLAIPAPETVQSVRTALQSAAIALGDGLQAIDINPVILGEAGAVAVDALVIPRP